MAELAAPPAVEPSSTDEDFSDRTWLRGPEGDDPALSVVSVLLVGTGAPAKVALDIAR